MNSKLKMLLVATSLTASLVSSNLAALPMGVSLYTIDKTSPMPQKIGEVPLKMSINISPENKNVYLFDTIPKSGDIANQAVVNFSIDDIYVEFGIKNVHRIDIVVAGATLSTPSLVSFISSTKKITKYVDLFGVNDLKYYMVE